MQNILQASFHRFPGLGPQWVFFFFLTIPYYYAINTYEKPLLSPNRMNLLVKNCGEGQAALPCQKWEISLIYCTKERQKGRRDPLIKCSPFEPCLICWLITSIRSCNKQRPFQTMMPICYGSTSVLELPAATAGYRCATLCIALRTKWVWSVLPDHDFCSLSITLHVC